MSTARFPALAHVFVDESKTRGYFIAAAAAAPGEVKQLDRDLRKITRPGQARVHFNSEKNSSRRAILSRITALNIEVQLYVVRNRPEIEARAIALHQLVLDLSSSGASRLLIERDAAAERADRHTIRTALVESDYADGLDYQHCSPAEHALLWVSDAVAWCHQAGGEWVGRAEPLVKGIQTLP